MVEHLLCKQGVVGSIPSASTSLVSRRAVEAAGDCHGKAERSGGILRGVACVAMFIVSVKRLVRFCSWP